MEAVLSWWFWLIVSILGYIAVGTAAGSAVCYREGRKGRNWDDFDFIMPALLWPIVLPAWGSTVLLDVGKKAYVLGETATTRKAERHLRNQNKKEVREIAREINVKAKQLTG